MKKEPSKTQENGISDTGIPMPDDILLRLVKEKDAGKEYMAAIREKLMRLLKEYLGQKYGRKVRFILPTGDPAGDLLDGKGFYPCSVTIYDKYGFAACSSAVSVELTAEGKSSSLPTRPEKSTTRKSTSQMTTCCPCAER